MRFWDKKEPLFMAALDEEGEAFPRYPLSLHLPDDQHNTSLDLDL
jgi:hypothetical protein